MVVKVYKEEDGKPKDCQQRIIDPRRVKHLIFGGQKYVMKGRTNKDLKVQRTHTKLKNLKPNQWISCKTHLIAI